MNIASSDERSEQNLASEQTFGRSFVRKLNKDWHSTRRSVYYEYLLSSEWKALRRRVIIRSKGICERCGVASVEEIHHLTYRRFKRERLTDLLGLCSDCHEKIHNIKNDHLIPLVFGG